MVISDNVSVVQIPVADVAAGGSIGTAVATVDDASAFLVNQTTAGQVLTIASPTVATPSGQLAFVSNVGTASFTMHGVTISPASGAIYQWNGTVWIPVGSVPASSVPAWALLGNAATTPAVNFLGTTDAQPLVIKTNSVEALRILDTNQFVGIGTATPDQKLTVAGGNIHIVDNGGKMLFGSSADADPPSGIRRLVGAGEVNEMLLWSGNDALAGVGPDRIKLSSHEIHFDTAPVSGAGDDAFFANVANSPSRMIIRKTGDIDIFNAAILRPVVMADFAADAAIGTSAATVDIASTVHIPQTTASIVLALPAPTNTQAGRLLTVVNTGTADTTVGGSTIKAGTGQAFEWDGTAWRPVGSASAAPADFWRSGTGTTLPDGTTDPADSIGRVGKVLIGKTDPTGSIAALEIHGGRNNAGALAGGGAGDIVFTFEGGDGYRNWITSDHDAGGDNRNRFNFWLNTAATPGGSSAPGTGNNNPFSASGTGLVLTDGSVAARSLFAAAALDVSGAVVFRPVSLADFAANGAVGTAAATVDMASTLHIAQATASIVLTLPAPTNAQGGRVLTVVNTGTVAVTVGGEVISAGKGQAFEWDGTVWRPVGSSPPSIAPAWQLLGNAGTLPATNFVGTTDAQDLAVRTNNAPVVRFKNDADVARMTFQPGRLSQWGVIGVEGGTDRLLQLAAWDGDFAKVAGADGADIVISGNTSAPLGAIYLNAGNAATVDNPALAISTIQGGTGPLAAVVVSGKGWTVFNPVNLTDPAQNVVEIVGEAVDTSGLRLRKLTNASPQTAGAAILGVDVNGDVVIAPPASKKYGALHAFVANTGLVITHALALVAADVENIVIQARDALGNNVDLRATAFTANTVTLTSAVALANIRIVIMG